MVISLYKPKVTCFGTVPPAACDTVGQELLDMLPTGLEKLVFGLSGKAGVQVDVPDVFTPKDTRKLFFQFPKQHPPP